jgi:hypothetical protein
MAVKTRARGQIGLSTADGFQTVYISHSGLSNHKGEINDEERLISIKEQESGLPI